MASSTDSGVQRPAIAITMGDPCGIGPEVVVKALSDPRIYQSCRPVVVGNVFAMEQAVQLTGSSLGINHTDDPMLDQSPNLFNCSEIWFIHR